MKKRRFYGPRLFRTLLLSLLLLPITAYAGFGQIKVQGKSLSMKEVIQQIERSSNYIFFYKAEDIQQMPKVSVEMQGDISDILQKLFVENNIAYKIKGNEIILTKVAAKQIQENRVKITGLIVDDKGEPIIGASIVEKGNTTNGTVTDVDGKYALSVAENATVIVSYIGYGSREVKLKKGITYYKTVLEEDSKLLSEVVVVGYGTQKKADLTGSVANVNAEQLNTQSNSNIGQALQGRIAGVNIVSQGGAPGAGVRIMVRGIGTLNNSVPLYIVDGMYMSSIDHINPNDIESIDVLKDASSAAIYGSRAANGVIIITTKKGSNTEGKPVIDLSVNVGIQSVSKKLDMLDAAGWQKVTTVAREAINKPQLEMATDLANKPDNNWQDIMFHTALMQNYNASVHGGGKYNTYYYGLGYLDQEGVVRGTDYQRYTLQAKNNFKKGFLNIGSNIILSYSKDKPLHEESRGGMVGVILQSVPTLAKYDNNNAGGYGGTYGDVVNIPNPLGMIDGNVMNRYNDNAKVFSNLFAEIEFLKGLKYKLNVNAGFEYRRRNLYHSIFDFGLTKNNITQVTENQYRNRNLLIEHLFTYERKFGDHKVNLLAGYSYQDDRYRYLNAYGEGSPEGLKEIDATVKSRTNGGGLSRSVLTSLLGRVFYSYKDRYLFTATIRRDGSSKFGKDNRYGNFPSFSLGWNMAEENFMKNISWISQLKIRGGYGELGNQEIPNYLYASLITTGINYPDGDGGLREGAFPKDFASPSVKWESTAMTNVGIDFMAFRNRLSLTADWYIKNTRDILLAVPIPISTGGANVPTKNAGEIRNTGFEFNIGWNDQLNKDFSYSCSFIGSFNRNKVKAMGTGTQFITAGMTNQGIWTAKTMEGYPIGSYWLIPTDGYFNSEKEVNDYRSSKTNELIQPAAKPGDIRFKDTNNDGVITDADRIYVGSPFPDFNYSINGNLKWKNFDLSLSLQGMAGAKIYNATRQTLEDVTKGTNFLKSTLDYWTPTNLNASHPRLTWDDPNRNTRAESDRYLENASYLRLRNLQVGYTIPTNWTKGYINKMRVYVNSENLFTITNYSGFNPDVNTGGATDRGFDNFIYPINRVFMLGLNVTF